MTPHTPRHAPQLGAHLHVMADEAGIDARDAMHDDLASLAICTDADAAVSTTQARIDAANRWADAIGSMCIDP